MKSIVIRSILMAAAVAILSARAEAAVSVSISMFQNDLDPYGSWVDVPSYGTCWAPAGVSEDWQPYTVGEWAYTDYDWTWVSHDRWGGMPYHYGTWVWVRGYGWVWIPGTVWAPAWVTWCYGDNYVGWAPIPPSINISYSGYSGSPIVVSQTNYVFVPVNRFVGTEISSARISRQRNAEMFRQSRQRTTSFAVSNGVLVNRGPSVQRIEQVAHTRIARQNVSVARVAPTQITAGGAQKGSRIGVIAAAPERARQFHAVKGGGPQGGPQGGAKTESRTMSKSGPEGKTTHEVRNATPRGQAPVHQEHPMKEHPTKGSPPGHVERHVSPPPPPPPPSHAAEPRSTYRESPPPPPPSGHGASDVHGPPPQHGADSSGKGRGGRSVPPKPKKEKAPPPPPQR